MLSDYYHLLRRWKRDYAPKMPEEAWHPLFVEALQKQSHVEYLLDVLLSPDMEERAVLIVDYGDYAEEILTREDFLNYNELYSKRIEEYDRKITELEAERQNLQTAPNAYPFLDVYRKYRKLEEITRPMIVELIEKIEVYEGNRVKITFRFQDEIADLLEELHQKQHEVSA